MLDPIEISGYWWFPDNSNLEIAGTLRFSQGDGARLELLGSFVEFKEFNELDGPKIILGLSTEGKPITLYKCLGTKYNCYFQGKGKSSYFAHFIFYGAHFPREDDIRFKSISVNYTDLDEWVGISGFQIYDNQQSTRTL